MGAGAAWVFIYKQLLISKVEKLWISSPLKIWKPFLGELF